MALGELALGGRNSFVDYERAAGWFRLAAARGDARAEVRLGLMYAEGVGVSRDRAIAASHFATAAAKQNADGAFYLGVAFLNGDGVPQNYPQAEKFFTLAASKGHGEAAYHLALLYDAPALGPPDPARAVAAMRAAARAGYPPAFAGMGLFAHRGDLVGDADGAPADWFEKGMRAGDPQSAFLYAVALFKGDGRAKDAAAARVIADQLIAAPTTPDALRASARRLQRDIARQTPGPLTLRD
ncbi:MAG: tetratricopeptide repeat protein [Parvularculaceae bacterium]